MNIIPSILWCNLIALAASSRRKGEVLRKRHELSALATPNSLGELLEELLAIQLTPADLINTINDDDAAVCSFERALQSLDKSCPKMLFVCFGVGGTARLVVGIDERVVTVNNMLDDCCKMIAMLGTYSARFPTRLDKS
jgi:hypothetical protein